MSYFKNDIAYIIVPKIDVTNEMVNNMKRDFNIQWTDVDNNSLAKNTDDKLLFKLKTPVSAIFNGYVWHNSEDIDVILQQAEWQ